MFDMIEYIEGTPEYANYKERVAAWRKQAVLKQIPKKALPEFSTYLHLPYTDIGYSPFCIRDEYIQKVGFAMLTEEWLKPLANWIGPRPCLEIMAGSGALSYALRKYGVNTTPTDNFSWHQPFRAWCPVENIDCINAIEKYGKQVSFIICSWPYMDDTAYRALLKMREINPKCKMIYIGEFYGCTADDLFFETLQEVESKAFYDAVKHYKSWDCIHDRVVLVK